MPDEETSKRDSPLPFMRAKNRGGRKKSAVPKPGKRSLFFFRPAIFWMGKEQDANNIPFCWFFVFRGQNKRERKRYDRGHHSLYAPVGRGFSVYVCMFLLFSFRGASEINDNGQ